MGVLTEYIEDHSYLRNALAKLKAILGSSEFATFISNSSLTEPSKVSVGYPNVNSKAVTEYEIYINTSNAQNCEVWDEEDGVDVLCIVDVYLPDSDLRYIWKYADATLQFLAQFKNGGLAVLDMTTRIYAKAQGDSANHFTISVHTLADVFNDATSPQGVEG